MPTNRTRRTRNFKAPAIDPAEIYFLQHGTSEGGPDHEHMKFEFFVRQKNGWGEVWEKVKDEIIADWIKKQPGTRPWAWWEYDAPRWERKFDAYFDGTLPEPRQRIGGIGTPNYEVLAYVPYFTFGIPDGWVSKFDEEYYNGRRKDIHGNIIPTKFKEGDFKGKTINENDPPLFESEAAYLDRHGLLAAPEKKHLASHPELLDPEQIKID